MTPNEKKIIIKKLMAHEGHNVEIVLRYCFGENIALECQDCDELIIDFNDDLTC